MVRKEILIIVGALLILSNFLVLSTSSAMLEPPTYSCDEPPVFPVDPDSPLQDSRERREIFSACEATLAGIIDIWENNLELILENCRNHDYLCQRNAWQTYFDAITYHTNNCNCDQYVLTPEEFSN